MTLTWSQRKFQVVLAEADVETDIFVRARSVTSTGIDKVKPREKQDKVVLLSMIQRATCTLILSRHHSSNA
jgi:hypothetical protein